MCCTDHLAMNVQASFNFYSEHIDSALPIISSGASYGDMIKQFARFHPNPEEDSAISINPLFACLVCTTSDLAFDIW